LELQKLLLASVTCIVYKLQEDVLKGDVYDFYDTYSIIRFNVIYPVSKNHPDAGAYAPFSLVIYKKKDE